MLEGPGDLDSTFRSGTLSSSIRLSQSSRARVLALLDMISCAIPHVKSDYLGPSKSLEEDVP